MNYLYNGVELPDINTVWTDKETYPYAHITFFDGGTYYIYSLNLSQSPAEGWVGDNVTTPAPYKKFQIDSSNPDWFLNGGSTTEDGVSYSTLLWSNHDIVNEYGTVKIAASDPVPVDPIDPTSLMMGWLVGRRVAAMRNK